MWPTVLLSSALLKIRGPWPLDQIRYRTHTAPSGQDDATRQVHKKYHSRKKAQLPHPAGPRFKQTNKINQKNNHQPPPCPLKPLLIERQLEQVNFISKSSLAHVCRQPGTSSRCQRRHGRDTCRGRPKAAGCRSWPPTCPAGLNGRLGSRKGGQAAGQPRGKFPYGPLPRPPARPPSLLPSRSAYSLAKVPSSPELRLPSSFFLLPLEAMAALLGDPTRQWQRLQHRPAAQEPRDQPTAGGRAGRRRLGS